MKRLLLSLIIVMPALSAAADPTALYRVVVDHKSDAARIVEVRLERRLEETELGAIVSAIIDLEPRSYPRTTVNFVLAGARAADGPWATATSLRSTQISVPGLTAEEERRFRSEAASDPRHQIGSWLTSAPASPGRLTIVREGDRLVLDWQMRGRLVRSGELTATPLPSGNRLDYVERSPDSWLVIAADGALEIYAKGALLTVAEPIRHAPVTADIARTEPGTRTTSVQPWPSVPVETGSIGITATLRASVDQFEDASSKNPDPPAVAKPTRKIAVAKPQDKTPGRGIDIAKVFYGQ
jgi:hypothetical protein